MSSILDILARVRRAKSEVARALEPEALRAGLDAAALVENRIVSTGRKANGASLSPYSTKPAPAFYYFGRSRNNAGESRVRAKAKRREGVSYKEFRQFNGLNTSHKNLEFTGEMWQGFGVIGARKVLPGVVEVEIGGKNERTRALLGYHSKRENTQITAPSAQELRQIKAGLSARLAEIISKNV